LRRKTNEGRTYKIHGPPTRFHQAPQEDAADPTARRVRPQVSASRRFGRQPASTLHAKWLGHRSAQGTIQGASQGLHRELHTAFIAAFPHHTISLKGFKQLCNAKGFLTGRDGRLVKGNIPANKGKKMPFHPNSARTRFKKGSLPHNTKFAGHERVSKDGYVEISVNERNPHTGFERRHVLKHRWLWEQKHGPVPKGMALKCKGDRLNTDPSNWELVPRALLPRLNGRFGRRYDAAPAEVKPTIMAIAKLEHRLREAAR
jgi:hypothetical protein